MMTTRGAGSGALHSAAGSSQKAAKTCAMQRVVLSPLLPSALHSLYETDIDEIQRQRLK